MVNYLILLPPSEGKKSGGEEIEGVLSFSELSGARDELYVRLVEYLNVSDSGRIEKLMELKGAKAVRAGDDDINLKNSKKMSVIERYNGIMFKGIDYETLSRVAKMNFDYGVVFIDGMFGMLRPQDIIGDYKLKIGSKFGGFNVSKLWKDKLLASFEEVFEKKIVIDMLPEVHRGVVDFSSCCEVYRVMFGKIKDLKLVNVGHDSKRLKGEFVREVVEGEEISFEGLKGYESSEGYKYSREYSGDGVIVYLKG